MKRLVVILGMVVAMVAFMTLGAQADPINGTIAFLIPSSDVTLTGTGTGITLANNTGFSFTAGTSIDVTDATGDLGSTIGFNPVTFKSFTFSPTLSGTTVKDGTELWSFTDKGVTYEFDMSTVSAPSRNITGSSLTLGLSGEGTMSATGSGLSPEQGTWTFNASSSGGTFSFYDSTAAVPEPCTLLFLGAGMTGLGLYRSRRNKKA